MSLRRTLNARLAKATGYRLVRAAAGAAKPRRRPERPRRRRQPFDDEARGIIEAVKPYTMTSDAKLFALIVATRYVVEHGIAGSIVECGVWRGGSMQAVARALVARGAVDRDLHLFDTFEGMPPPSDRDRLHDGRLASTVLAGKPKTGKYWAVADLADVRAGMAATGYPPERVHFHPGLVEQTIPAEAPDRIAILRLDTDWYESTRHELDHLYDRVPSGGVLILDDYGYWQGARAAVDEFLGESGARLLLVPMASGRIAVKP